MDLRAGMHIKTTRDIMMEPYGTLPKGSYGVITAVWPEDGTIAVLMSRSSPQPVLADDVLVFTPFDNEEDAAALQVCHKMYPVWDATKRQILPRFAVASAAWGVWELFVQIPLPNASLESIESISTLAVFLATGAAMGIKAAISTA